MEEGQQRHVRATRQAGGGDPVAASTMANARHLALVDSAIRESKDVYSQSRAAEQGKSDAHRAARGGGAGTERAVQEGRQRHVRAGGEARQAGGKDPVAASRMAGERHIALVDAAIRESKDVYSQSRAAEQGKSAAHRAARGGSPATDRAVVGAVGKVGGGETDQARAATLANTRHWALVDAAIREAGDVYSTSRQAEKGKSAARRTAMGKRDMSSEGARDAVRARAPEAKGAASVVPADAAAAEEADLAHSKDTVEGAIADFEKSSDAAVTEEKARSAAHHAILPPLADASPNADASPKGTDRAAASPHPAGTDRAVGERSPRGTVAAGIDSYVSNVASAKAVEVARSEAHSSASAARVAAAEQSASEHAAARGEQEALAKVADSAKRALVANDSKREGDSIAAALGEEERGYLGDHAREAGKVATQRSEKVRLEKQAEAAVTAEGISSVRALVRAATGEAGSGARAVLQDAESKLMERRLQLEQAKADAAAVKAAGAIAQAYRSPLEGVASHYARYEQRLEHEERTYDAAKSVDAARAEAGPSARVRSLSKERAGKRVGHVGEERGYDAAQHPERAPRARSEAGPSALVRKQRASPLVRSRAGVRAEKSVGHVGEERVAGEAPGKAARK
ncbi:hypothetical protein T484DRAFT_3530940 [Baffinella frigidus]|nr:hypothetical protein T484DRAFT_3530940 [Cryptophyta sp. CCMP2293]